MFVGNVVICFKHGSNCMSMLLKVKINNKINSLVLLSRHFRIAHVCVNNGDDFGMKYWLGFSVEIMRLSHRRQYWSIHRML